MKVYRCEDCENCIGHTCNVFFLDTQEAILECFKCGLKDYKEKKHTNRYVGINFKYFKES